MVEAVLDRWARKRSIPTYSRRKVPFVFRTLPGYTFYASQIEPRVGDPEGPTLLAGFGNIPETSQRSPGWIRITCKGPDDDEELEFFGFAGPES